MSELVYKDSATPVGACGRREYVKAGRLQGPPHPVVSFDCPSRLPPSPEGRLPDGTGTTPGSARPLTGNQNDTVAK
jgi:hypothetical protein